MMKPAPLSAAARLAGGCCFCLLAWPWSTRAQTPASSNALTTVVNPDPSAPKVEAPGDENKPSDLHANDTEILASQGATFAAKDRIAVFSGDVRVRDPRFTLACRKLTVFLAKASAPGSSPAPASATTPPPAESPGKADEDKASGIDHAVAEGDVIIIKKSAPAKPGEEEKTSIARCDIGEFDNKTGDMTLRGMPRVEQGGNLHEALSRSTVMILHRDNSLDTHGPSRTYIVPQKGTNLPGSSPSPKAGTTPPSASPAVRRTPGSGR